MTSPIDAFYNCVAHAAGDSERWWEPTGNSNTYWPETAPLEFTLAAYEAAFASIGYARCDNEALDQGIEKIAIFVDGRNVPQHAARQLADGTWTSKLGPSEDISHPLRSVEGSHYGRVALIMCRRRT